MGDLMPGVRRRLIVAATALAAGVPVLAAHAQGWGGSLGLASDNLYRGLSLSDGQAAWLADAHWESPTGGWIAGLSAAAQRSPSESASAQLTAYVDRRWQLDEDWSFKVGAVHYQSPWSFWQRELRYSEINTAIGYRGRWRATLALSPDRARVYSFGPPHRGMAAWGELDFRQPLVGRLAADVGIGYARLQPSGDRDYSYGSAGFSYGVGDVSFFLTRTWTSSVPAYYVWDVYLHDYDERPQPRATWVASAMWTF